jgi:hypothetical protein
MTTNPVLRKLVTPSWPYRVGDCEVFMTQGLKDHLKNEGIQLVGDKTLASTMPV